MLSGGSVTFGGSVCVGSSVCFGGAVGGSASSDNIGPMNLLNIRRVAYGTMELADLRREVAQLQTSPSGAASCSQPQHKPCGEAELTKNQIEEITKEVLRSILANR